MPSPSKTALVTGVILTTGMFFGGAYAASLVSTTISDHQRDGGLEEFLASIPYGTESLSPSTSEVPSFDTSSVADPVAPVQVVERQDQDDAETATQSKGLVLNIDKVRNGNGNVYVLAFADQAAYDAADYSKAVGFAEASAKKGTVTVSLPEFSDGPYAIFVFHDENDDEDLNVDSQGYPTEGYGTSNAKSRYDTLSFEQALIKPGTHSIRMFYL